MSQDTELLTLYGHANAEFDKRMHLIGSDDWSKPTPCADWDVRTLVNHLVYEVSWVPALLEGQTIAEIGDRFEGDLLGDDPLAAWHEASSHASQALHPHDHDPGVLDRTVHLSYGDSTARDYVAELMGDLAVHSWDLARGIGGDDALDTLLVDDLLMRFEPKRDRLAASGLFGAPVDVAPDAPPQTRLLAMVGRAA